MQQVKKLKLTSFNHKIALLFATSFWIIILISVFSVLQIVLFYIDSNAKTVLRQSIEQVVDDFQTNELQSSYSRNLRLLSESEYTSDNLNIAKVQENLKQEGDSTNLELETSKKSASTTNNLSQLQQSNQVFARVFLANGDLLFSSDLFDTYTFINPDALGFRKLQDDTVCLYIDSVKINGGEESGSVVQVAQYCNFNQQQQRQLLFYAVGTSTVLAFIAYGFANLISRWLLRPLYAMYHQTERFSRQVYHELLTPISVALSTVETAQKTKRYKEGIDAATQELQCTQASLQALNQQLHGKKSSTILETIELESLCRQVWESEQRISPRKDLILNIITDTNTEVKAHPAALRLLCKNMLSNVLRHSDPGTVTLYLSSEKIEVKNPCNLNKQHEKTDRNDTAIHGVGLSINQDICNWMGWNCASQQDQGYYLYTVTL